MKIDDVQSFSLLSCKDFCRLMEEDGAAENDALIAHLKRCPTCRREYEVLTRMRDRRVFAEPPADLVGNVMRSVRAERARAARRRAFSRVAGVACAAILLVPALTVLVPMMQKNTGNLANVPEHVETPCDDDAHSLGDGTAFAPDTASAPVEDAEGGTAAPPSNLPEGFYSDDTAAPVSPLSTTASENEPAFYAKLRALVGEDAFDAWLAQYEGDAADAEAAAYAYFGIERE